MVHWIGVNLIVNNQGLLASVRNLTPDKVDGRLWQTDEYGFKEDFDLEGNRFLFLSLFYNSESDRNAYFTAIKKLEGMIHSALPGSYIVMTECWHDEKVNGLCTKLDKIVYEERV